MVITDNVLHLKQSCQYPGCGIPLISSGTASGKSHFHLLKPEHVVIAEHYRQLWALSEGLQKKAQREYDDLCLYWKDLLEIGLAIEECMVQRPYRG